MLEHAGYGQMDAVGRGAVDIHVTVGCMTQVEGAIEGQGVACATAVALRRHHRDLALGGEAGGQLDEPRREIAVVVAEQDAHGGQGREGQ
jgi:hypothetical protein